MNADKPADIDILLLPMEEEERKDAWQCSKTTEDSAEDGCSVATVYSCYRQGKALGSDR